MNELDLFVKIYNAATPGQWNKLSDIKRATGLTQAELERGIRWILENNDDVSVEPEPFNNRLLRDPEYAAAAVRLGEEDRHLIKF